MSTHAFTHLDRVIDEVHALFDAWAESGAFEPTLDAEGADVLRLAVHEWIANLVQHAVFPGPVRITLEVEVRDDGVRCAIADSSAGFDFVGKVEHQKAVLDAPAPSERGRGLLMVLKCAEDLAFEPAGPGTDQRIAFTVRDPSDATMARLFRPEDLTSDYSLADDLELGGDGLAAPLPAPDARRAAPPSDDR